MPEIKLSGSEIGFIAVFGRLTKATPKDCIINDDASVTFVVNNAEMGLAIGKKGANIRQAEKVLKRNVDVVEYSADPVKFIRNVMYPIRPKDINIEGKNSKTVAKISVSRRDRAAAIGSRGRNIKKIKRIVTRHHDIDDVVIV
ncbi:MAG: NusA-like transcription termination signal-binding factor [Candidatus Hydrothermarchaeales archaeon]